MLGGSIPRWRMSNTSSPERMTSSAVENRIATLGVLEGQRAAVERHVAGDEVRRVAGRRCCTDQPRADGRVSAFGRRRLKLTIVEGGCPTSSQVHGELELTPPPGPRGPSSPPVQREASRPSGDPTGLGLDGMQTRDRPLTCGARAGGVETCRPRRHAIPLSPAGATEPQPTSSDLTTLPLSFLGRAPSTTRDPPRHLAIGQPVRQEGAEIIGRHRLHAPPMPRRPHRAHREVIPRLPPPRRPGARTEAASTSPGITLLTAARWSSTTLPSIHKKPSPVQTAEVAAQQPAVIPTGRRCPRGHAVRTGHRRLRHGDQAVRRQRLRFRHVDDDALRPQGEGDPPIRDVCPRRPSAWHSRLRTPSVRTRRGPRRRDDPRIAATSPARSARCRR